MSRYPGTQFKVHDNSQATAIVPVSNTNISDAVQYLTSFASVKGPEGITLTAGEDFYTRYGTQDNIDFKKYGQPLFQASMNVNNGAALLAKRAVLDDATLGNATLGVVLTKYKDGIITPDTDYPDLIGSIDFIENGPSKYSIAPMVFSIDNSNGYKFANTVVNEYKEKYDLYKEFIEDVIANDNTPDNKFLNKLYPKDAKDDSADTILSGFTQSIYYDKDGKLVDVNKSGKADVRKVSSITVGSYNTQQNTYSSNFDAKLSIIDNGEGVDGVTINSSTDKPTGWTLYKLGENTGKDKDTVRCAFNKDATEVTYKIPVSKAIPINRIIVADNETKAEAKLADIVKNHPEWNDPTILDLDKAEEYAIVVIKSDTTDIVSTTGYTSTSRLMNDLMIKKSKYIICEYVFPMFTIFDNGRGESIKSISIEYDAASSVTLKKALYTLSVYNYATAKRLEKFNFSLNPYARNNNTGYSFDIESSVNYNSKQISVKEYYESYDALLETLQLILGSRDDKVVENYDILFGHNMNGSYPAFNSYAVSNILKRNTYIYDYAHLDVFDNDVLTVNTFCDSDNMTEVDDAKVKYYYYNYIRQQKALLERLEMGSDGDCLSRTSDIDPHNEFKVPFIVIDTSDNTKASDAYSTADLVELTGQKNGSFISDSSKYGLTSVPTVPSNFCKVKLTVRKATMYTPADTGDTGTEVYISDNDLTRARTDIIVATKPTTVTKTCYVLSNDDVTSVDVYIPLSTDYMYQEQYRRFFSGEFDKDIFNLDIYFPNAIFDANYANSVKLAIQRLAAYRGDFMCYMDMGVGKVNSYADCFELVPSTAGGIELTEANNSYSYVRDMHIAVTCLSYKIRNPYDNKVIAVSATYGLSNLYINHFANDASKVFAGISNGITINNAIGGTINYIPKIYPTSEMTSLNNIGGVYPSDDETIINEKQLMCDLKVNYGCYYDDRFSIETEYTMNATESEFSYWNNVALVCLMMQAIRKACPSARYQFITANDLSVYKTAVEAAMEPWKNKFADIKFKYVQDEAAIENKIFYAAIEVVFKPFAQAEIFELTALNYSTLSSNITNV
nr:MAG TPA: tail sheath protein [Caudoviricetes sp.]